MSDNETSETMTRDERDEAIEDANAKVKVIHSDFAKYSDMWKEVVAMVLEKAYSDQSFFNRLIKDFADNNWSTSTFALGAMKSFKAGIAVYGKLSTKTPEGTRKVRGVDMPKLSQFELAMEILRQHPSILVENYAADVGVDIYSEGLKF